jgi:fucose permease
MTTTTVKLTSQQTNLLTVIAAFLGFIGIGLNGSLIGIAWTPMSPEFGQPLESVGILLFASTAGYLTISFMVGTVTARIGIGATVLLGAAFIAGGLAATAFAQAFWLLIPILIFTGVGSGLIDAGFNAYISEHHSKRTLNWLHACFGIGATVAPLIVTALLNAQASWRIAFLIVASFCGALTVLFFLIRGQWRVMAAEAVRAEGGVGITLSDTLRLPAVWIGVALFFVYAGMESSPGVWMFPLYTKGRGIAEVLAGTWVSLYWGVFTIGRIVFGAIINYVPTNLLIRACFVGILIGTVLIWWNPSQDIGVFGLILFGFAQAPMFAVFISQTASRVGIRHAPNAIGFQVAGAGIGVAGVPALIGILQERISLEIIPPFLFGIAIVAVILYEVSLLTARKNPDAG